MGETLQMIGVALGAGGASTIFTILTRYMLDKRKMSDVHGLASQQQEFQHTQRIITRQEKRITDLEEMHKECLEKHETCLELNAQTQQELGRLREAVARLEENCKE